ncbi:2'-5' RNA ligase family protein [Dactylosporangium cerinum]
MRLFIAAYLPDEVERHFAAMVGTLAVARPMPEGRSLRLVPAEQRHMTLAFIGDVEDERRDDAVEVLEALPQIVPRARIGGGGRFGRGSSPRWSRRSTGTLRRSGTRCGSCSRSAGCRSTTGRCSRT